MSNNLHSCFYFMERVNFPIELLKEMDVKIGDPVSVEYKNNHLHFKMKNNDSKVHNSLNNKAGIPLSNQIVQESKIKPGDVILFTVENSDKITGKIYDSNNLQSDVFYSVNINGNIVPPGWICQSFTSNPSSEQYYRSGYQAMINFENILSRHDVKLDSLNSILDFGCGASRVLSPFRTKTNAALHGIDLHKNAIKWCIDNVPFGNFQVGKTLPPMNYENNKFDFLYAISVLTHLNEEMQNSWLMEFQRILKPDAILIVSYRGEDFIEKIIKKHSVEYATEIQELLIKNNGFYFENHERWKGVFPNFYTDTYHSHNYIKSHWGKYFDILELIPSGGFSNNQNAAVLKNKS